MDLNRVYSNPKLEARRQSAVARLRADSVLRDAKRRVGASLKFQVENAFDAKAAGFGAVFDSIRALIARDTQAVRNAFETLVRHLARAAPDLVSHARYLAAAHRLCAFIARWLRASESWAAKSHNTVRRLCCASGPRNGM